MASLHPHRMKVHETLECLSKQIHSILVIINKGKGGFHHYLKADPPTQHPSGANGLLYNNPLSGKVTVC